MHFLPDNDTFRILQLNLQVFLFPKITHKIFIYNQNNRIKMKKLNPETDEPLLYQKYIKNNSSITIFDIPTDLLLKENFTYSDLSDEVKSLWIYRYINYLNQTQFQIYTNKNEKKLFFYLNDIFELSSLLYRSPYVFLSVKIENINILKDDRYGKSGHIDHLLPI